jgi:PAS domain S-box-containing protein
MPRFMRRSLLSQLLSVYLIFVVVVLIGGVAVNAVIEQQLSNNVQASDKALAQEIATQTSLQLRGAENSVVELGKLVMQAHTPQEIESIFQVFQQARTGAEQGTASNVDHLYWLDPLGSILVSCSPCQHGFIAEFAPQNVVEQTRKSNAPVFVVGMGITAETSYSTGVIIAYGVHVQRVLSGIVAISLSLRDLSVPLQAVVAIQKKQGRSLDISILDERGELIATPDASRILWLVSSTLPGANQALRGQVASRTGMGADGQEWLFSSVPVPSTGWAVVVQRPVSEALSVVEQFHLWLLAAAILFTFGGLLFWLLLLKSVINPLHLLAARHQSLPNPAHTHVVETTFLTQRHDEVGDLARSLSRLEQDGVRKLSELHTLLETSNEVVRSLDPLAVVRKIIQEARRLVDMQAAAVLLPDEQGVLRVLVSDGHSKHYDQHLALSVEDTVSAPVLALRNGTPIQKLLGPEQPSFSYNDGFRSVLAIPIISRHAGGVVLLVHRTEAHLFEQNEIDLLLTFANYATLAWEHAVLYERSDERLREVARENEQLYQQASAEQHKLAAIMGSMSDGLVLTGIDGRVLYTNAGASQLVGIENEHLERQHIAVLYTALHENAADPLACEQHLARLESGSSKETFIDIKRQGKSRFLHLRLFDVRNERGDTIGRGLLLRDVTRERELDEFKSTLLAAVGHEVRTPLAGIKGIASTLLQQDVTWSLADQRHFLQTISSEADRLAQLVSNLLDLSRQEAGLLLLNRAPVRLRDLVNKGIARAKRLGTTLVSSLPDDLPLVDVDSARIEIVLHNLVTNALTYGDGHVWITARKQDALLIVSVSNNGPGIATDELPHVFERFYRAHNGRQQHSSGTGLGLTICRAFIEAHGTHIWAESDEHGTSFSFSLPCASLESESEITGTPAMQHSMKL